MLLAIAFLGLGARLYRDADRYKREDFKRYYAEARLLSDGGDPWRVQVPRPSEIPRPATTPPRQIGYPPAFYLMLSPLSRFQPAPAHLIWEALQFASLIFALLIALTEIGAGAAGNFARGAFAFAFLFPPLQSALHWGQPTPMLLLLLVASWSCARRGRDIPAGILLAAATLLKVFPWTVAGYFLFRRRWTVITSAILSGLAASGGLVVLYGIHRTVEFLRGAQASAFWLDRTRNLSIIGNLHWLLSQMAGQAPATVLFGVSGAAVCASFLVFSGRLTSTFRDKSPATDGLCWSLWVLLSILLSPVAWDHYLTLLIPMYIFLAWRLFASSNESPGQGNSTWPWIGPILIAGGLTGFLIAPYFAAARHMRCYMILALASYAGLSLMLRQYDGAVAIRRRRASADQAMVS
ncbi:MAG TPA: glycosyltransferase family 87 protein [Candidatus Binataceae bacterium]|nr:glycosyltransferase family 87 protein [Candidatus Binataceae bacterium]